MWLTILGTLKKFVLAHKKDVAYITTMLIVFISGWHLHTKLLDKAITQQSAAILQLQSQYTTLLTAKTTLDAEVKTLTDAYTKQTTQLQAVLKKDNPILHRDQPAETAAQADEVQHQIQSHVNIDVGTLTPLDACREENTTLTTTLNSANLEIVALQKDKTATEALLANSNSQVIDLTKLDADVKKTLADEQAAKRFWRKGALGEAGVLGIIILIHLL